MVKVLSSGQFALFWSLSPATRASGADIETFESTSEADCRLDSHQQQANGEAFSYVRCGRALTKIAASNYVLWRRRFQWLGNQTLVSGGRLKMRLCGLLDYATCVSSDCVVRAIRSDDCWR